MPSGWVVDESADDGTEEEGETYTFMCEELPRYSLFTVGTDFRKGDFGPLLGHSVSLYSPGKASEAMADLKRAAESCTEWESTLDDGTPTTMRVQPMSFVEVGEDRLAVRVTMEDLPLIGTAEIDSVYVLYGDTIMQITHMAFALGGGVDSEQTEAFAQLGMEKLEQVLDQTAEADPEEEQRGDGGS